MPDRLPQNLSSLISYIRKPRDMRVNSLQTWSIRAKHSKKLSTACRKKLQTGCSQRRPCEGHHLWVPLGTLAALCRSLALSSASGLWGSGARCHGARRRAAAKAAQSPARRGSCVPTSTNPRISGYLRRRQQSNSKW